MIYSMPTDAQLKEMLPWIDETFDIRSLFIPKKGYKFVLCDLAQIEPRVLAWMAGQTKMLEAMAAGFGVYEAAAVASGKYSGVKGGFKKMRALYQAQKAQTLALGYQCGWERYIEAAMVLARYDVCKFDRINEKTGKPIYGSAARTEVTAFRKDNPEIPALWNNLDEAFKACEGGNFFLELPSGRCLVYRDVRKRKKQKVVKILDEETGLVAETKIKEAWVYSAEIDGRRYEMYGGALTENAVQAGARDVFGEQLLELDETLPEHDARLIFHAHDEAICEVPMDFDPEFIRKIMMRTPKWLPGCPLDAEAKEAFHYLK